MESQLLECRALSSAGDDKRARLRRCLVQLDMKG